METIPGVAGYKVLSPTDTPAIEGSDYTVDISTGTKVYGRGVFVIKDREAFGEFEAAVHNFSNTAALHLESLEYQNDLENQVRERTAELEQTIADKELLLREIHHRVKNNFSMVTSLLRLQFGDFTDEHVRRAVGASIERISSMSLVHQFLYQSDTQSSIDFHSFVDHVIEELIASYGTGGNVDIVRDIGDVSVGINIAAPVSLIINELVTNALKYAFPENRGGTIRIETTRVPPEHTRLLVSDDGVGLPDSFDIDTSDSLGMQLIKRLTAQIQGTLDVWVEEGTTFVVTFPEPTTVPGGTEDTDSREH